MPPPGQQHAAASAHAAALVTIDYRRAGHESTAESRAAAFGATCSQLRAAIRLTLFTLYRRPLLTTARFDDRHMLIFIDIDAINDIIRFRHLILLEPPCFFITIIFPMTPVLFADMPTGGLVIYYYYDNACNRLYRYHHI